MSIQEKLRAKADELDKLKPELPQSEHRNTVDDAADSIRAIADDIDQALRTMGITKGL